MGVTQTLMRMKERATMVIALIVNLIVDCNSQKRDRDG